jgi:hypothetical protein
MLQPKPVKDRLFIGDMSGNDSDVNADSDLMGSYVIKSNDRQSSTFGRIIAAQFQG